MKIEDYIKKLTLADGRVYIFNSLFFLGGIIILLLVSIVTLQVYGFDKESHLYIYCPQKSITPCENPLYHNLAYCGKNIPNDSPICQTPTLMQGNSYGTPPPFIVKHFLELSIIVMIICFILNHFIHNKGFKFKTQIKIDEEIKK